jgi:Tol biopolymer transport system component
VRSRESGNWDIWVHDIARGATQRLTFDPASEGDEAIWLPKGDRISFSSNRRGGSQEIYVKPADGTGEAELLVASPAGAWRSSWAFDWSADEKYMIFDQEHQLTAIYYLKRKDDGSGYDSVPFIAGPFDTHSPKLSPDNKYLAYVSNESGRYEVYVEPFPQRGRKVQISVNGGRQPRWRGDGKELFYVEGGAYFGQGNALMAVPVTTVGGFSAGEPQRLFESAVRALLGRSQNYTVTPDGQKFILVEDAPGQRPAVPTIQVTQNWFAEFRNRKGE